MLCLFFFNVPSTTELYPLSLHDALPICSRAASLNSTATNTRIFPPSLRPPRLRGGRREGGKMRVLDRKSTRLNSSHRCISYAVFCLKKKKKHKKQHI